jgi:hypothetical protein
MRYLVMHKASPEDEAGVPPSRQLIDAMGELICEALKAGILLGGEGLHPTTRRWRVRCRRGDCAVQKGPYPGAAELPAAFAAIRVRSADEALQWSRSFAQAIGGDVDLEVGALVEEWDIGGTKPEGEVPLRFLVIQQANEATESGAAPSAASRQALGRLLEESTKTGVLQFYETLQPSREGRRLTYRKGQRAAVDGPFAESKELVGGFCILRMQSFDEVAAWTDRYARILGGNVEIDLRVVSDTGGGR